MSSVRSYDEIIWEDLLEAFGSSLPVQSARLSSDGVDSAHVPGETRVQRAFSSSPGTCRIIHFRNDSGYEEQNILVWKGLR